MTEHSTLGTTLIMGLGNLLLGDEGFGVHVARRLKDCQLPDYVRVEEGGVGGFNLLGHLEGVDRLLVVDVMMVDSPPGKLILFKPGPNFGEPGKRIVSFHQVGALELVHMWGLLGYEPEILFLVTRPEKMEWSMELSPPLQSAERQAVKLIGELCLDNFNGLERGKNLCIL
ncbi:hydrogenase maturation protease [Chloroflexota bacterium]